MSRLNLTLVNTLFFAKRRQLANDKDSFFGEMPAPATDMELLTGEMTYKHSNPARSRHFRPVGFKFLTPAEIVEVLPGFQDLGTRTEAKRHPGATKRYVCLPSNEGQRINDHIW